jgi:hypothetical protein
MIGIFFGRGGLFVAATLSAVASAAAASTNDTCPFEVGDTLSPLTGTDLSRILLELPLKKDVFETSAEFNSRKTAVLKEFIDAPAVALTYGDPNYPDQSFSTARYDADLERIFYNQYFISNGYDDAGTALKNTGTIGQYDFDAYIAFDLSLTEQVVGTYSGGNALGASVTVSEVLRRTISIAQLTPSRELGDPYFNDLFMADMPKSVSNTMAPSEVLGFEMPIDVAKEEFSQLQTAVAFQLEEPYLVHNENYIRPVITNPEDRTIQSTVLLGNIYCAAVLNSNNVVLDVARVKTYD